MSAKRKTAVPLALACGLLGYGTDAIAEDEELPEIEFLEYLGSWEESDEDWLVVDRVGEARRELEGQARTEPAPEGKESPEKDDES